VSNGHVVLPRLYREIHQLHDPKPSWSDPDDREDGSPNLAVGLIQEISESELQVCDSTAIVYQEGRR
jgi:hypothetical protein